MKRMLGKFFAVGLLMSTALGSSVSMAQEKNLSRRFATEAPAKKPLPAGAVAISNRELRAADPITFEELRLFVRDWRKYARWLKTNGNEYKAVAYLGVSRSSDYPPEVVKWMDEHGWAVDRFFLLEQKFRKTLSVQKQEKKQVLLQSHIEQLKKQVENDASLSMEEKKEKLLHYNRTIENVHTVTDMKAPVTPEEYELIKLNHDVLERILAE